MRIDVLRGILPLRRDGLVKDVLAGITLAALGIPEVMGYTKISQTPLVTGLYTLLLPVAVFAVLGSSRHLVVGADSATAAILAGTLVAAAAPGSADYLRLTGAVALSVAVMLLLARVFRLGFLADFLSRSALIGFLTGVGFQVAISELAGLVGLPNVSHTSYGQLASFFERLGSAHGATLGVAAAVLAIIVGSKRLAPKLPGALIAVVGGIAASAAFDLSARGIAVIGKVPGGLPAIGVPALRAAESATVLATAASCFLVIVAQSAATARAYAMRYNERDDENADLVGLAGANAAAALTGTFVVNGSPTKTEMVDDAGGRSQIAHLTTAAIVLLVLLFLTEPLSFLPAVVLSAIVFMIGVKLVDLKGLRELWRLQRDEFWVAVAIAALVVGAGVMQGIVGAVVLSLLAHVRHNYRPRTRLLVPDGSGGWKAVPVAPGVFAAPGVVAYRFESDLFYANASGCMDELFRLVGEGAPRVRWLVVDASGINDIDYSAAKTLMQMRAELERRGVRVATVAASADLRGELARYGLGLAPQARLFPTVTDAMASIASETERTSR